MSDSPRISILHGIPGRIRMQVISTNPDWKRVEKDLRGHPGIEEFRSESRLSTVVIRYDSSVIEEAEVVLRIALSLSISAGLAPVVLEREIIAGDLDKEALLILIALAGIGILRIMPGLNRYSGMLGIAASILTGASILSHAASEMRQDGTFHPETLSIVYLLVSAVQGKGYSGAVLSWLATHGRHFKGRFVEELVIQAEESSSVRGKRRRYDMTLQTGNVRLAGNALTGNLPALLAHALAGGKPGEEQLLSDFRSVSKHHGNMLEGLEGLADGITLHIR